MAVAIVACAMVLLPTALSIPQPVMPGLPLNCVQGDPCMNTYLKQLSSYNVALWWRQTPFDIAEGLLVVAGLLLALPRLKVPEWPRLDTRVPLIFGGLFTFLFALFAFVAHIGYWVVIDYNAYWLWPTVNALRIFTDGPVYLGVWGFGTLVVACAFVALNLGMRNSVFRFGAPAVLILMVSLAVVDLKEMSIHVTNFTAGLSLDGFDLVSNWFVLMVSGCLTLLAPPGLGLPLRLERENVLPDGWWKIEPTVCPKCHEPAWTPYQSKVTRKYGEVYSYLVYRHPSGSGKSPRKCTVQVRGTLG